jgi:hypothetical protein
MLPWLAAGTSAGAWAWRLAERVLAWARRRRERVRGHNPWEITVHTVRTAIDHRQTGHAAEMSFFALLTLVPSTVAVGAALSFLERFVGPQRIARGPGRGRCRSAGADEPAAHRRGHRALRASPAQSAARRRRPRWAGPGLVAAQPPLHFDQPRAGPGLRRHGPATDPDPAVHRARLRARLGRGGGLDARDRGGGAAGGCRARTSPSGSGLAVPSRSLGASPAGRRSCSS